MTKRIIKYQNALVIGLLITNNFFAQSIEEKLQKQTPDCSVLMHNAINLLPAFYTKSTFDSIAYINNYLERNCGETIETIQLKTLLALQFGRFKQQVKNDSTFIEALNIYGNNSRYYTQSISSYDQDRSRFYLFTRKWAIDLLSNKKMDVTETFVCNALAGNIPDPEKAIRNKPGEYPELFALLKMTDEKTRNKPTGYIGLLAGAWMPTNNAAVLGVHPNLGVQLGARTRLNQFDFILQFKFANTPKPYQILRNNILYDRSYFFGGFIGLDYTRYVISKTNSELGITGSMGYDGFDIANNENNTLDYLKPTSIGCFNTNIGLQYHYFFNPRFYIGMLGRYHFINYKNTGGTNLKGDAITLDLVFGFSNQHI